MLTRRACVLLAAAVAMPLVAGAEPQRTRPLRLRYEFQTPRIDPGKPYDRVSIEGLFLGGAPGAPALPCHVARVVLPAGTRIGEIAVRASKWQRLAGSFRLAPVERAHAPIDGRVGRAPGATPPDPDIFGSARSFPAVCWRRLHGGRKHGRRVELLELWPLRYTPVEGRLESLEWIEIELEVVPEQRSVHGAIAPGDRLRDLAELDALGRDDPGRVGRAVPAAPGGARAPVLPEEATIVRGLGDEPALLHAIITPSRLAAAFEPLAAARRASGLPSEVVTTESIYARFDGLRPDGGADDATRLREFIREAYNDRGLRFVLLGGDADGATDCDGCEPVVVPTRQLQGFVRSPLAGDLYFGCLDGTFDGDADGIYGETTDGVDGGEVDLLFEVSVGRAPVDSVEEAGRFVAKTLAYESSSGPILREVLLVGEHLGFGGGYTWGGTLNDQIARGSSEFIETVGFESSRLAGLFSIERLYDRDALGFAWAPADVVGRIERGVHLVNHVGHADISNVMKLTSREIAAIGGGGLFVGYSQSCYAGSFDNRRTSGEHGTDSVVEHLLTGERGAVAMVANSRRGWAGSEVADGPSQRFNRLFWDTVLDSGVVQIGPANDRSRERNLGYALQNERARWCYLQLNTLGDPALGIKLAGPRGVLAFEEEFARVADGVTLVLIDADLDADPEAVDTAVVSLRSADGEIALELVETGRASGIFRGPARFSVDGVANTLRVSPPGTVIARYEDADVGDGSPSLVEVEISVVEPIELASDCPPRGAIGVPYEHEVPVVGGQPPYRFAAAAGYVEEVGPGVFEGVGVSQGWRTDDGFWLYALPFRFPFFGELHDVVTVSSNGFLELGEGNRLEFSNSTAKLIASKRIAPLWADLVTSGAGDIFIDEKLESVTIRWRGTGYTTSDLINAEVELFADGHIRFGYGRGNEYLAPTIGVSAGDGERYFISELNGLDDGLEEASTVLFTTRLPDGLSIGETTGLIRGMPREVVARDVSIEVSDALGQVARRLCRFDVRPDGFALVEPAGGALLPVSSVAEVRWEWFGDVGGQVRLDYNLDGSTTAFPLTLAERVEVGERVYEWTLPDAAQERVRLRIQSVERPELFSHGEPFSIVGPTLVLLRPADGERWVVGGQALVRWESIGAVGDAIGVDYRIEGEPTWRVLTESTPNSGELRITVPPTPTAAAQVRVRSLRDPAVESVTERGVSIVGPSISLLSPDGGECLRIGDETVVTWSSEGFTGNSVLVDYNLDGSATEFPFTIGERAHPNTGSLAWDVDAPASARGRVRVRSASDPTLVDISDGVFSFETRCRLRTLLWVPLIGIDEEQVVGTERALRHFEPDVEIDHSLTLTPEALRLELENRDAFVVVKQKLAISDDLGGIGADLAATLADFAGRGGAVVLLDQTDESQGFIRESGLIAATRADGGTRLCELVRPGHPVARGVRPNFSGSRNTSWYEIASEDLDGRGVEVVATSAGGVVVASRDLGFGRVTLLGFDYYNFNNDTARLLANAARVPLPESGIRLVAPSGRSRFEVGESISVRWFARGDARGRVRLRHNTTGLTEDFPEVIVELPSPGDVGTFRWTAPPIPDGRDFLEGRLMIESIDRPEHRHVAPAPFFIVRPLRVLTEALPPAAVGLEYETQLILDGGVPPYTVIGRSFPAGLTLERRVDGSAWIVGVPQRICSGCEIEIVARDTVGQEVEAFFPLEVSARRITVTRPIANDLLLAGSDSRIDWRIEGPVGETATVLLDVDAGGEFDPADAVVLAAAARLESGELTWRVPIVNAPLARLRVRSNEDPRVFGDSAAFSIVGPTSRVLVPNGGECWERGRNKLLRWRTAGNGSGVVRIEYNLDGSLTEFPGVVSAAAPDTGELLWSVPDEVADAARVRVSFVESGTTISDSSDASFRVGEGCLVRGVVWTPCRLQGDNVAIIEASLEEHIEDVELVELESTRIDLLDELLVNRDVLIVPLMSSCRTQNYRALGTSARHVLDAFVASGGVVVLCAPTPVSAELLVGLGLGEGIEVAALEQTPVSVSSYLHPVVDAVPLEFTSSRAFFYEVDGPAESALETLAVIGGRDRQDERPGRPVVLASDRDEGRWVVLGFDFTAHDAVAARILSNAARMKEHGDGLRMLAPPAGSVFSPGESVTVEWAARGDAPGEVSITLRAGQEIVVPVATAPVEADEGQRSWSTTWAVPNLWELEEPPVEEFAPARFEARRVESPDVTALSEGDLFLVRESLRVVSETLETAYLGADYVAEVEIRGGVAPYRVDALGLPAGLVIRSPDGDGQLAIVEGTPRETTTGAVLDVLVTDALGSTESRRMTLDVLPSRIRLVSPGGGEFLLAGSEQEVLWSVLGYAGETVRIEYNLTGSSTTYDHVASESAPVGEPFVWRVPDTESEACRLRVISNQLGLSSSTERSFAISPPRITCLHPNGGERFESGTRRTITWRSLGNDGGKVRILAGHEAGVFDQTIVDDAPDTGAFVWNVPEIESARCRIRVESLSDGALADVSDRSFTIRYRAPQRALVWIAYTEFDRPEVRGAIAAVTVHETDFRASFSSAVTADDLERDLIGKEALIVVQQDPGRPVNFAAKGRQLGPLIERFARRGGTAVFLKQRGVARELLTATGLLEAREIGRGLDVDCDVVTPDHPLMHAVPARFRSLAATGWYEIDPAEQVEVHATAGGHPVVLSRRIGDGRVALVGFDYRDYTPESAKVLANAVRMVTADYPRPRFVRGDILQDGQVNIADATVLLDYLFFGGEEPACLDAADVDDSASARSSRPALNVGDAVHLLRWLFSDGRAIPSPAPRIGAPLDEACGRDPQLRDGLECRAFRACEAEQGDG